MSDTDPYMAPEAEEAQVEETSEPVVEKAEESVPEGSIKEVLEWVDGDVEKAKLALSAETDGENRKTLITKLNEIVD